MLTKTYFKNFLACRNEFWLDHHFPEPKGDVSLEQQLRREAGYEVETLARTLSIFTNGAGRIEFGRKFTADGLYAKADIVAADPTTGEIDIYEVKSGTKAKEDYQIDLAFQCIVASKAGFTVRRGFLITLDTSYVFDGCLDVEKLLRITDESEFIEQNKDAILTQIATATALLNEGEPSPDLLAYCGAKLECRFIVRHYPNIPDYNVSHLFNSRSKKLDSLLERSILHLTDIPPDFAMTERESAFVEIERSQTPYIDYPIIRTEINGLAFPLNFLDYESVNPAVPKFQRTRSYQQMVFQYSLHTIDEPGGELRHSYHLSRNDGRHPTEEIVERLHEDLNGRIGTVLIWSEGFEKTRNTEIAGMYPEFADFLTRVNDAVYDLRDIFQRRLYMHPGFRGKNSIKKILPVLCPGLSYDGMDIADGMTASIKWYHMATGRGTPDERQKIYQDLEKYCELDTFAMVEIYRHLLHV